MMETMGLEPTTS